MEPRTSRHRFADSGRPSGAPIGSQLGRFVPLAGAGSAALTVAGYLVIGPNPDSGASTSKITAYYAAHHAHVFAAGILLMYSTILFALFGVAIWERIRRTALHPIVAGAALVATALATSSNLANASAWYLLGDIGDTHTISPGALQTLHISVSAGDLPSVAGLGILLLAFASAGILARAFPRWLRLVRPRPRHLATPTNAGAARLLHRPRLPPLDARRKHLDVPATRRHSDSKPTRVIRRSRQSRSERQLRPKSTGPALDVQVRVHTPIHGTSTTGGNPRIHWGSAGRSCFYTSRLRGNRLPKPVPRAANPHLPSSE